MTIKRVIILALTFCLIGCFGLKNPKKPKNLIPKDKMVNILIDIRLITSSNTGISHRTLNDLIPNKETFIYNKYNIDSLQFALSNEYYTYHIEEYNEIYTKVKDSLLALRTLYKDLEVEELRNKKKQDSITQLMEKDRHLLEIKIDSLKTRALISKDTLRLNKKIDSIRAVIRKKDSLRKQLIDLGSKEDEYLISPVSDTGVLN